MIKNALLCFILLLFSSCEYQRKNVQIEITYQNDKVDTVSLYTSLEYIRLDKGDLRAQSNTGDIATAETHYSGVRSYKILNVE